MLRRLRHSAAFTAFVVGLTAPAVAFNPAGRSKKPKAGAAAKPHAAAPRPAAGSRPGAAAKPRAASAKPADAATVEQAPGSKAEGPSRDALIARYLGIVLSQPGSEFPLDRLTALYRERDGNLEQLLATLSERVAKDPA
ncbi:MAG TPA: hypothetical protein VEQ58_07150, partial [Polyangiaceae bacterium]|nr:hypothetical protein [Polyangiaceae bacterium]